MRAWRGRIVVVWGFFRLKVGGFRGLKYATQAAAGSAVSNSAAFSTEIIVTFD